MFGNGKKTWRRIGILVLLLGGGLGGPAYGFAGGTGEPNDPYQIATVADLVAIGADSKLLSKYFVLVNDLDLDPNLPGGRVFEDALIARDTDTKPNAASGLSFSGVLDGQGHVIRRLCLAGKPGCDAGLFGKLSGLVRDLHLADVRIEGSPCGALAGRSSNAMILGCSVTGKVTGSYCVGGLIANAWDTTMIRCEARADVGGDESSTVGGLVGATGLLYSRLVECRAQGMVTGGKWVGGLLGSSGPATTILRCAARGQVVATGGAGGLLGQAMSDLSLVDCYARGSVTGSVAGGLVGDSGAGPFKYILNNYAACEVLGLTPGTTTPVTGGLFGKRNWYATPCVIAGCFWDAELSQLPVATGSGLGNANPAAPASGTRRPDFGTGLTTRQMQERAAFEQAGWDFSYAWALPENGYPVLQWELLQDASRKP